MKIIKDSDFLREKVPMTKEEIRTISISKLELSDNDIVLDIGGGTGAMAISMAINIVNGKVITIEKKDNAIDLIYKNKEKFKVSNLHIIKGLAPEDLDKSKINKVFIGGTFGKMKEIFDYLDEYLLKDGIVVLNFITLENIYLATQELKKRKYKEIEIIQATISKGNLINNLTLMKTNNSITIIKGVKNG